MKVTVIIPNYNGLHYLKTCLPALKRQSFTDFETILVDNGSSDGSTDYMCDQYPEIHMIRLQENKGFSRAVNLGIKASASPYVLLLNNDTIPGRNFILRLVQTMEKSKCIFSVSSKMLRPGHPSRIDSAGDLYTLMGYAVCRGAGRSAVCYPKGTPVFSACGGAALYRRELFRHIGYFDEHFFAYLEDVDLGYRARLLGYANLYCPQAYVYHVRGGTAGKDYTPFKVYYSARNNICLLYKNMPALQLSLHALPVMAGCAAKYIYFRKRHLGKDYLRGLLDGLRTCRYCESLPFDKKRRMRALKLEAELFRNTLTYLKDFLLTH